MPDRTITASRFKAECLGLIDDIARSGTPLLVTKRGRPLVRVVPVEPAESLAGSVTFLVDDEELAGQLGEQWYAAAPA